MNKKRIFITGGTGIFGRWLLGELQRIDVDIVLLTRNPQITTTKIPELHTLKRISLIQGDIRDFKFPEGTFDYVIHAATPVVSDDLGVDSDEMYSIIVDGTQRVLEFAKQANVKRLLFVSSGAVYGTQPPELEQIPETYPCNPITAYGKGKLDAENLCITHSIPVVIARCFAFVGPYLPLNAHFAIGNFIGNCLRNEPIIIKGDGTPLRSYMYATDLAEWLLTLLVKGKENEIYNVGSDQSISITDLAKKVREISGTNNEIIIKQKTNPSKLPARYIPNIKKANHNLGLQINSDLKTSVLKTFDFYKLKKHL